MPNCATWIVLLVCVLLSMSPDPTSAATLFKKPTNHARNALNPTHLQGRHPRATNQYVETLNLETEATTGEGPLVAPNPVGPVAPNPAPVPVQPQVVVVAPPQSVKLRPRVGLEVELDGTVMILYKGDAPDGAKLAPIQYSQSIRKSATNALGDTPYFAATIDSEKLSQYRYDAGQQKIVTINTKTPEEIQAYFNANFKAIWDGSNHKAGVFGMIELVSGPMELAAAAGDNGVNDQEHKDLQVAMTEFLKALLPVRACGGAPVGKIDVPYFAGKTAVPFSAVLTAYHAALDTKNQPDRFNKFKMTEEGTYPKPKDTAALAKPAGYEWYIQCNDAVPARNLQVNFGYPLANFGLIPGQNSKDMTDYMTDAPKNTLTKMRTAAKKLLAAQQQTSDPAVKDHKDTRGVMTLLMLVAINRYRFSYSVDKLPTVRKDLYQFLPKVSWGQLRDKLPDTQKNAVNAFLAQGTAATKIVDAIIAEGPPVPLDAPAWVGVNPSGTSKLKEIVDSMLASPNTGGVSAGLFKMVDPFYLDNDPTKLYQAFVIESRRSDCNLNQKFIPPVDNAIDPAAGLTSLRELTSDMQDAT